MAVEVVNKNENKSLVKKMYTVWRDELLKANNRYQLFSMMVIRYKNCITNNYWKDWKRYVKTNKVQASILKQLQRQCLLNWYQYTLKKSNYKLLQANIIKKKELRTKYKCFLKLVKNHSAIQASKTFLWHKQIVHAKRVFKEFKKILLIRFTWKRACVYLQSIHIERIAKLVLTTLKSYAQYKKDNTRKINALFKEIEARSLKKVLRLLKSYVKRRLNSENYYAGKTIRGYRKRALKRECLLIWKKRAHKALLKVKGLVLLIKIFKRLILSVTFFKYRKEVKFLSNLNKCIISAKETFRQYVILPHNRVEAKTCY